MSPPRLFMAHHVISLTSGIWSLSGDSGHGRTYCWLDPVADDPLRTWRDDPPESVMRAKADIYQVRYCRDT